MTAVEARPASRMTQCRDARAAMLKRTTVIQLAKLKKGLQARRSICLTLLVSQEIYSPVS